MSFKEAAAEELAAELEQYDGDVSDLAVVPKAKIDELSQERDDALEARDEAQEELGRPYAERLSETTGFDTEDLMDRYSTEELQAEYDTRLEELKAEQEAEEKAETENLLQSLDPAPKANTETEELAGGSEEEAEVEELSVEDKREVEELASHIERLEGAGGHWANATSEHRERFEELTGESYDEYDSE